MNYTIDANVFVASARAGEPEHLTSLDFLTALQTQNATVFCPSLVLAESSAAISRRTGNPVAAMSLVALIENFSGMRLEAVSVTLAERAAQIAADHRLLGADAIYVAVAEEFTATLVTLDNTILQRAASLVAVMTPEDWLIAVFSRARPVHPKVGQVQNLSHQIKKSHATANRYNSQSPSSTQSP